MLQGPEALDLNLKIAGIGARSHAFLIDWHIRILLALTWVIIVGFSLYTLEELSQLHWEHLTKHVLMIWLAPAAAIYFFYHPLLEVLMSGRTPGKRMAGVRIVNLEGMSPSASALLIRNLFRLLDSLPGVYILGLVAVALTKQQVRIGDLAAGLVLVYDQELQQQQQQLQLAAELALSSELDEQQQILLLDILARWPQLDQQAQIDLSEKFLAKAGKSIEPQTNKKQYCKYLHQQLQAFCST